MLERNGRRTVDHLDFAFNHVNLTIFEVSITILEDCDRDERVDDLGYERTGSEFPEVVFVELFGVDLLIEVVDFGVELRAVPDEFYGVLFFEQVIQ